MAKPYQEGKGWSIRLRCQGQDIYLSGFSSETAARHAAENERAAISSAGKPAGAGPRKTTLAQAFQKYASERLPSLKGARKDAGRINRYLRLCGLKTIELKAVDYKQAGGHVYFTVTLRDDSKGRNIPNSLQAHRSDQLSKSYQSDVLRTRLGSMLMSAITPHHIQKILDAMVEEGYEPATIAHERSELRRLFNHSKKIWLWTQPGSNPASPVTLPRIQNGRERVLSNNEWDKLSAALQAYDNPFAFPAFSLLLETTMRSSEPLLHATWADVDWDRCVIRLQDAKAGARTVPLGPNAIQILKHLKVLSVNATAESSILPTTYEALKKAWKVACEKAGIKDANPHDLRHTGTTRYAIELNGNMPVLKLITGHKTDSQLMRYINLKPDDVVSILHNRPIDEANAPAGLRLTNTHVPKESPTYAPRQAVVLPALLPNNVVPFPSRKIA